MMTNVYTQVCNNQKCVLSSFCRRQTINKHLRSMTLEQRLAFGLWYSEALTPSKIAGGHQSLIADTGNLIAYLPFHIFQHLSPAQVIVL